jgi:hypothetical protein
MHGHSCSSMVTSLIAISRNVEQNDIRGCLHTCAGRTNMQRSLLLSTIWSCCRWQQATPTADMLGCRATVVLLILTAVTLGLATAQQEHSIPVGQPSSRSSSSATSKLQPKFLWPRQTADRCWAPGTTPRLDVSLLGILDAKVAAESYTADPGLLFDGYW